MTGMFAALLAAFTVFQAAEPASAVCQAPVVPTAIRPVKPSRPPVPPCVDEARSRHNCRPPVIAAYNRQMGDYSQAFEAYVAELTAYGEALNRYVQDVNQYTLCERKAVGAEGMIIG